MAVSNMLHSNATPSASGSLTNVTGQSVRIEESSAVTESVKKVLPAVVTISSTSGTPLGGGGGIGSGFVFDARGWILTNRHVVSGADTLSVRLNDTRVFLPEHNLTYSDKAAMAASIETRPPLADYRIVEKMFTLPPGQRIRGNVQKYLLKKASERYLPHEIVHRPKAPFNAPLRAWMRGPLAPMVDELLSESSLKARGFYHPPAVRALIANDRRGVEDNGMVIWTLLTTEIWFRTFLDCKASLGG